MTIEFLFKPEAPIAVTAIKTAMSGTDYAEDYDAEEKAMLEAHWATILAKSPKAFSIPGSRATLTDSYITAPLALAFRPTDFKTYAGTAHHKVEDEHMRPSIYEGMRIAAIGGSILTADGYTLIHRRPSTITHGGNMLDSSFAGLVDIANGELQIEASVKKKLKVELKLEGDTVSDILLTGVHSGRHPDYSCMFDVIAKTPLSKSELEKQVNKELLGDCHFMTPEDVPAFLMDHFNFSKEVDMLADGCAVMLTSLPHAKFAPTVDALLGTNAVIKFGHVKAAKFYEK